MEFIAGRVYSGVGGAGPSSSPVSRFVTDKRKKKLRRFTLYICAYAIPTRFGIDFLYIRIKKIILQTSGTCAGWQYDLTINVVVHSRRTERETRKHYCRRRREKKNWKKKEKKCKKEQIKNIIHCTFMSTRVYLNRKDRGTRRRDAEYVILSAARDYDDVFFPRGLFSLVHLATKSHEITSETRKPSYVRANVKSTTAKKKMDGIVSLILYWEGVYRRFSAFSVERSPRIRKTRSNSLSSEIRRVFFPFFFFSTKRLTKWRNSYDNSVRGRIIRVNGTLFQSERLNFFIRNFISLLIRSTFHQSVNLHA